MCWSKQKSPSFLTHWTENAHFTWEFEFLMARKNFRLKKRNFWPMGQKDSDFLRHFVRLIIHVSTLLTQKLENIHLAWQLLMGSVLCDMRHDMIPGSHQLAFICVWDSINLRYWDISIYGFVGILHIFQNFFQKQRVNAEQNQFKINKTLLHDIKWPFSTDITHFLSVSNPYSFIMLKSPFIIHFYNF